MLQKKKVLGVLLIAILLVSVWPSYLLYRISALESKVESVPTETVKKQKPPTCNSFWVYAGSKEVNGVPVIKTRVFTKDAAMAENSSLFGRTVNFRLENNNWVTGYANNKVIVKDKPLLNALYTSHTEGIASNDIDICSRELNEKIIGK